MRRPIARRSAEEKMIFFLCTLSLSGLLPLSILRFSQGDYYIATIELVGALANSVFLLYVYRTGKTAVAGYVLAALALLGVSAIIFLRGTAPLHFLYPVMIASFFFIKPNVALTLCLCCLAAVSVKVTPQLDASEGPLFIMASVACILFSYVWANIRNKQRDELFELSSRDGLTGCGNRRAMNECIDLAIKFHRRNGNPVSLLIIDLDNFKQINDLHGHSAGDQILRDVSTVIKSRIRSTDDIFRYGGDEFVVLAPNSNLERSLELAEKLRTLVAEHGECNNTGISISLGVAQYQEGQSSLQWLNSADTMLLKAKREGKNLALSTL